jgi:endopeptidase La
MQNIDYKKSKVKNNKKKDKYIKNLLLISKKISSLINQVEFLFKNKFIIQESYIEYMFLLNETYNKYLFIDKSFDNIDINYKIIDNYINELNLSLQKICISSSSDTIKNTLEIFFPVDEIMKVKADKYNEYLNLYDEYFVPLSCRKVTNVSSFLKDNNIANLEVPNVVKLIDFTKNNTLIEKINGASIIFVIDKSNLIYINGYFKKDSLNIFKLYPEYNNKFSEIKEELLSIDIPLDFKENYLDQLSLRDFIILEASEISEILKNDYKDFITYKNKSLSSLIKDFIKSNIEKQRKIIILLLISDQESQFTAHIIFDLITDKSFLSDSQYLSDILFNSLHWKIQKIFKVSSENFDTSKKKLENISINDIPYESRILTLKCSENIKIKAMEKLKEINGSKENSIKAQQWLDGFLKIPFNTFKKEPIINFFKDYQNKIEQYIEMFTLRMSEYNVENLNSKNNNIYNIIIQIIDEYHSIIYKSENSYSIFIKYIENIKLEILNELGYINFLNNLNIVNNDNNLIVSNVNYDNNNSYYNDNNNSYYNNNKYNINENYDGDKNIIEIIDEENIPTEDVVNDCINQLTHFKKIKDELYKNNIVNKNNLGIMVQKLGEIESKLNIKLIKNSPEDIKNIENEDDLYNIGFKKYIMKNLKIFEEFVNEWNSFIYKKKDYMIKVDKILDKCTYGQRDAKNQMKRIIGQWMNGASKGQCFGLCGPPGVGKTTLCKNGLAKCLFDENGESRPFAFLPLGGATNGSILEGHHYTYMGSTWGKIIDILMETKCMNPIIYVDELDKISKTEHGKEIASILTHITDQSQNKEFYDRYFASIPVDLSQVLFIFSYNDRDSIDRILRDRIQEIDIKSLSVKEKLVISQNYIIPEILNNVGFSQDEIIFTNDILMKIINEYTYEAGVRKLNEILYDIVRDINLNKIMDETEISYPVTIDENNIKNILSGMVKINSKKMHNEPRVGIVNGLYATTAGLGGLTVIQVMRIYSDKKYSLEKLTGSQGDVMKESMNCAMTLAWNILPENIRKEIEENKEGFGLHIHCPEGATPKDGPSAGLAITLGIISRLTNISIRNDVAMTGEVDLIGNAHEIGGLYSKLQGAYQCGINKVLIPFDNKKDLDIIFKKELEESINIIKITKSKPNLENYMIEDDKVKYNSDKILFRGTMEIVIVNNIYDILKYGLVENNLEFIRNF